MKISFKNATCGYNFKEVIGGLDFEFCCGQATCILGPNGVGKTTIFKSLIGDIPLIRGNIYVDKVDIAKMSIAERAHIFSYVPQASSL